MALSIEPIKAQFTGRELDLMNELRAATRDLEALHRAYTAGKERHQRALGQLSQLWGGATE